MKTNYRFEGHKRSRVLTHAHTEVLKCKYVYLEFVKPLKHLIHYTDQLFCFFVFSLFISGSWTREAKLLAECKWRWLVKSFFYCRGVWLGYFLGLSRLCSWVWVFLRTWLYVLVCYLYHVSGHFVKIHPVMPLDFSNICIWPSSITTFLFFKCYMFRPY